MSEKISRNVLISVALFSLAGEIAWAVENQYYNVFMYNNITSIPIYVSLMVNITTIVGTIATLIMGSYSDVLGKRKPFFLYGFILWAITTALFPVSAYFSFIGVGYAIFFAILFDSIMTFFGATSKNATFNAYITDVTTLKNRGKALSIAQITLLLSLIIVYGISGILIETLGDFNFFYIIGAIVGIMGLIGVKFMNEPKKLHPLEISTFEHIKNTFRKKIDYDRKNFFIILLVICCWCTGLNVFFPFLMIYLQHQIGLSLIMASFLIFIALTIAMISSYPLGILTDKIGRKKMTILGVLFFSISVFLIGLSTELILLLITGTLCFIFYSALNISTLTWIKDFYPKEGRGQFSGYYNLFAGTIPMLIGPQIGGWFAMQFGTSTTINGRPALIPTSIIFFVSALVLLLTFIPLYFAKDFEKR